MNLTSSTFATRRTIASTATVALQLALAITLKSPCLCQGFSLAPPQPVTKPSGGSVTELNAHARRSHTFSSSSTASHSRAVFDQIDRDGNGQIDANELTDYLKEKGPYTDEVAKSIFQRLDKNHDGQLELLELEEGIVKHNLFGMMAEEQQRLPVNDPQKTFAIKAKTIEIEQYKKKNSRSIRKQQQLRKYRKDAQKFFELLDANHDGFISLAEMKEHFMIQRMEIVAKSSGLLSSLRKEEADSKTNDGDKSQGKVHAKFTAWHHHEQAIQNLFQLIDANADGRISLHDLKEAFARYPSVRHAFQE